MPDPVDVASTVAENFVPPELKSRWGKLRSETKWQAWVAGGLAVTSLGSAIHVALACGYLPFYAGFASAGDMDKLKQEVTTQVATMEQRVMSKIEEQADTLKTQRINTLKKDLFDTRQKQCKAPSGAVRTMMTEQISNMQSEYETLVGKPYTLPGCGDF